MITWMGLLRLPCLGNLQEMCSHGSRGYKLKIKVSAGPYSLWNSEQSLRFLSRACGGASSPWHALAGSCPAPLSASVATGLFPCMSPSSYACLPLERQQSVWIPLKIRSAKNLFPKQARIPQCQGLGLMPSSYSRIHPEGHITFGCHSSLESSCLWQLLSLPLLLLTWTVLRSTDQVFSTVFLNLCLLDDFSWLYWIYEFWGGWPEVKCHSHHLSRVCSINLIYHCWCYH